MLLPNSAILFKIDLRKYQTNSSNGPNFLACHPSSKSLGDEHTVSFLIIEEYHYELIDNLWIFSLFSNVPGLYPDAGKCKGIFNSTKN